MFSKLMYLPLEWHDNKFNNVGRLATLLSSDIEEIQNLTSNTTSSILQAVSGLLFGIIIAIISSWKLTLYTFILIPIVGVIMGLIASQLKKVIDKEK